MIRTAASLAAKLARVMALVLCATLGTTVLMRVAPGYFAESQELDAAHAGVAREQMEAREHSEASVLSMCAHQLLGLARGDLGRSRQFDIPVAQLLRERARTSAGLIGGAVACGWLLALALALPLSARRSGRGEVLIALPSVALIALPVGALATACLVSNVGGPLLVLSLLVFGRDFRMVYRLLQHTWAAPHFLYARAQGIATSSIVARHLTRTLRGELAGLAVTSFVLALSACVPVEAIFDVPGLGQLAWSAALNRDLPVLLGVTLLMAGCVGVASVLGDGNPQPEVSQCA